MEGPSEMDEIRELVAQTLEAKGVMGKIKVCRVPRACFTDIHCTSETRFVDLSIGVNRRR